MERAAVCLPGNEYGGATLPILAASDSGVTLSPGTPLRDEADNRSLMRDMLAVMLEINEDIKQLNEKLNKDFILWDVHWSSKQYITSIFY